MPDKKLYQTIPGSESKTIIRWFKNMKKLKFLLIPRSNNFQDTIQIFS